MGNDGGSIPDRRDLVRTKPKAEQADKANQTRAKWLFCALSKRKLQEPIVSCALGKLYNKDSIIEFLLDRSVYGDGENICGHVRSLKDVRTLKMTLNSSLVPSNGEDRAEFVCPLSVKEMNGSQPFVYVSTCGCVFSQAGLRTLTHKERGKAAENETEKEKEGSTTPSDSDDTSIQLCPNCATKYTKEDVVRLNPSTEEEEILRFALERKRKMQDPTKKRSKKRRNEGEEDESTMKKKKKKQDTTPVVNAAAVTATSRAVASELEKEEAKRKESMSEAVKSLYSGGSHGPTRKETFMTRGTFTRYA